jgi:antitoxin MazE
MKANIIQIGNSKGIRIPKALLEQTGFGQEVELEVIDQKIIIHSVVRSRQGWDQKFKLLVENQEDRVSNLEDLIENQFDRDEWEW